MLAVLLHGNIIKVAHGKDMAPVAAAAVAAPGEMRPTLAAVAPAAAVAVVPVAVVAGHGTRTHAFKPVRVAAAVAAQIIMAATAVNAEKLI